MGDNISKIKINPIKEETLIYVLVVFLFSFLLTGYNFFFSINYHVWSDIFFKQDFGKPFVTRALIIWLARFINFIFGFKPPDIFAILELVAFILSGITFSLYINSFFDNLKLSRLLSFTIYFIIPFELILPHYQPLWFPYDAYALLFTTVCLLFMKNRNFRWYYFFFTLATINRETTFFLTIIMLFVFWNNMPVKKLILHLTLQFIIWAGVKLSLEIYFLNQDGMVFQYQYWSNIKFITDFMYEGNTTLFIETFFRPAYLIGNFAFIYLLLFLYWKKLDDFFLRRSVLVIIPFYLIMLYVGNIYEYRIFAEMIPVVLMPSIYILIKIIKNIEMKI